MYVPTDFFLENFLACFLFFLIAFLRALLIDLQLLSLPPEKLVAASEESGVKHAKVKIRVVIYILIFIASCIDYIVKIGQYQANKDYIREYSMNTPSAGIKVRMASIKLYTHRTKIAKFEPNRRNYGNERGSILMKTIRNKFEHLWQRSSPIGPGMSTIPYSEFMWDIPFS